MACAALLAPSSWTIVLDGAGHVVLDCVGLEYKIRTTCDKLPYISLVAIQRRAAGQECAERLEEL